VSVGYPDRWPSHAGLEVVAGQAYENADRVERFDYARQLAKLQKPVDRSEWFMTPQTVNAVNLPAMNALNFPAAILERPFFDRHRPAVMNYAAIGAVIGHEISHSFDNEGSTLDAHSPGPWRARTVRNLDAWYRAFDAQSSDSLYLPPDQRVRIW